MDMLMVKIFNNNAVKIVPHTLVSFYHSPGVAFTLLLCFPRPQGQWFHSGEGVDVTVSCQLLKSSTR